MALALARVNSGFSTKTIRQQLLFSTPFNSCTIIVVFSHGIALSMKKIKNGKLTTMWSIFTLDSKKLIISIDLIYSINTKYYYCYM